MQIDRWTIDASDEQSDDDDDVNFSVWIDPIGPRQLAATYFTQEKAQQGKVNPIIPTPIPPRASAQAPETTKVRPRYPRSYTLTQEEDVTRIPTLPQPTMWQYDSAEYQAESSLSSLSLVVPEMAVKDKERRYITPHPLPAIEERKTTPPAKKEKQQKHRAIPAVLPPAPLVPASEGHLRSWTAGGGTNSLHAKRIISTERHSTLLNPLDRVRWWLLYPGRIEFLLWFVGTITLMAVTCIFLFVTIVSFGWISPGGNISVGNTSSSLTTSATGSGPCTAQNTPCSNTKASGKTPMLFYPLTQGPLEAGMSIRMQGQNFTPRANVMLTHDGAVPCQPTSTSVDAHGAFVVDVGTDPGWRAGSHALNAYDTVSKRLIRATILIAPGTFGKSATPGETPIPGDPGSGVTPTVGIGGGNGGGQPNPLPTPVGQYPVTPTPAASPTATPKPTQSVPTPTPTVGVKPSPTQLPKPTPTVGTGITPTPGNTNSVPSQVISLKANVAYYAVRTPASVWLWLVLIGYALSMVMLGIAGVLHRRNRTQRTRS